MNPKPNLLSTGCRAGKVGEQRVELWLCARRVSDLQSLGELIDREPTERGLVPQPSGCLLPFSIGGAQAGDGRDGVDRRFDFRLLAKLIDQL